MKKALSFLFAFLVVAGGVGYFVTHTGSVSDSGSSAGAPEQPVAMPSPVPAASATFAQGRDVAQAVTGAPTWSSSESAGSGSSAAKAASVPTAGSADGQGSTSSGVSQEPFIPTAGGAGPRIIKTADLSVEVEKDGFDTAFDHANLVAQKYGGFVMSSSSSGEKARTGDLLIRVPSKNFELAMSDLRGLGETKSESVNGQEVTDQFIDLNARLRTWQAQENVLMRLMDKANSISETMTVQRELQQVQYQIEQIKGQLRMLRDQTSFGTISLTLSEPGVVTAKPKTEQPSLAAAWDKAVAGFLSILAMVIVGLGYLIPLSLIALAAWLVVRRVRGTDTPPAPTTIA